MIKIKKPKIFFGWFTVLALGVVSLLGSGIAMQSFSVFFKPLASDLGLSRAATSVASSVQMGTGSLSSPFGGWASDKYGPRRIMLIGIIALVVACTMMFFINSFWTFIVAMGIMGMGASLGTTILCDKAIVNWFVRKSGIAINMKFAIMSLSGLLILPLMAWLVESHGWRTTYVIGGIAIAVICIPLVWLFVKPHRPEYYGLQPDGAGESSNVNQAAAKVAPAVITANDEVEFTFREAIKTSAFWMLVLVMCTGGLVMPMMSAHAVPFMTDRGINPVEAASIMGLAMTVGIPARLITGAIFDRLKINSLRFMMAGGVFIQAVGVVIFIIYLNTPAIYAWFVLFGIGSGIQQSVNIPMMARYFGRKAFGSITGLFQPLALPIGFAAPIVIGYIYDSTGSYMNIIYVMPLIFLITAILTCFIVPPQMGIRSLGTVKSQPKPVR